MSLFPTLVLIRIINISHHTNQTSMGTTNSWRGVDLFFKTQTQSVKFAERSSSLPQHGAIFDTERSSKTKAKYPTLHTEYLRAS